VLDADFWSDAMDWLARYAKHEPDWADACLAVVSGHDRQIKIWTFDREFRTTWRRPNGTRIPLAVERETR
jgi:predicted nucleic acid-binding protein